jgi:ribonuclease PH
MNTIKIRIDGRSYDKIRPINVQLGVYEYAPGSILFEMGKTKILCSVSFVPGVPQFLKKTGMGWLSAEYSMLPASTRDRIQRDTLAKQNGRSTEISRLIGRSLRAVVDTTVLGENTLWVDCDVLQADGGTRTASINAAYLALKQAQTKLLEDGLIKAPFLKNEIASVSAGIYKDNVLLDLNFEEDSKAEVDVNFVLTKTNDVIEIQGTAEGEPISWENFDKIKSVVQKGIKQIFTFYGTLKL